MALLVTAGRQAIVELTGLPGTGKTSIAGRLGDAAGAVRTMVMEPTLNPLVSHPWDAARAVRWGLLRPGLAWPAWAKLCLLRAAQDDLAGGPATVLLLEEGLVHHTWRTLLRHPAVRSRPWARLVEAGPPLLVLQATRVTRHGRLQGKLRAGDTNRQLASGQPDEATWGPAERLFEEVLAVARRNRRVVEITTDDDLDGTVRRAKEAVEALS